MKSRKSIVAKLDKEFSLYIRQRTAVNGKVTCFTCGKKDDWQNMDCGHFMSRKHYSTRWDEDNCQVQCKSCNVFRYGEQFKFGVNLNQLEDGLAERLLAKSRLTAKFSNYDLIMMIEYYQEKNKKFIK